MIVASYEVPGLLVVTPFLEDRFAFTVRGYVFLTKPICYPQLTALTLLCYQRTGADWEARRFGFCVIFAG